MKKPDHRPLTPESVKQLYATLTQYYDTELIEHWRDDAETQMAVLTLFLNALGVKNVPAALKDYSFTMMNEIYLPFEPGFDNELADGHPLLCQAAICASVHQRVLHARECDRPNEGHLLYMLSPVNRVHAELAAIRALFEVFHWYFAAYPEKLAGWGVGEDHVNSNAASLLKGWFPAHGCTDLAVELAEAEHRLKEIVTPKTQQGVRSPAARDVISFFGWDVVMV